MSASLTQQSSLQEKFNSLLAGEYGVLHDSTVANALPPTVVHLLETGKNKVAERLIERIIAGLNNRETSVRQLCSLCLTETAEHLAGKNMRQILDKLLPSLKIMQSGASADWVPENVRQKIDSIIATVDDLNGGQKPAPAMKTDEKKDTLTIREEQIFHLFHSGNREEAKRQLFDLIVACAKKKDFKNAERLRERIYEIDPMALMEIIQSGEIIEEEKSGSISKDLLQVWSSLLQVLTQEEFNALYHAMETRRIKPEETLVSQGTKNDELFFINTGCLRISYFQTGTGGVKEVFLKNLGSGEIAGENFFNATVWTVSLTGIQQTQISILKRDELARLEEINPGIESKLRDYYTRSVDIAGLLNRKGIDRRIHERFRIGRKIHLQITGAKGKVLSSFRADMEDISLGGLSFVVRITKKENSRLLLGRDIKAIIPLTSAGEQKLYGTVIGVQICDPIHSDYSVHVKFDDELERHILQMIIE